MKKKIIFALAIMMICLSACGGEKAETISSSGDVSSSVSSSVSKPNSSEDPDTPVSNDGTQSDDADKSQVDNNTQTPSVNEPEKPAETPSNPQTPPSTPNTPNTSNKPNTPAAPNETPAAPSVSISDIGSAIDNATGMSGGSFMTFGSGEISSTYGLDSSAYDEATGKMPLMNVSASEYLVVKAKDGQVETVKNAMLNRQSVLDAQWKQYLPEQYEYVKNYKLVTNGNYVLFVVGENADAAVSAFNSLTK